MSILNFVRKDRINIIKSNSASVIHKLYMVFNKHTEELLSYEKSIAEGLVPSKGYFFIGHWMDWIKGNFKGYFFARTQEEKVRNIEARFKFSKTNTLDGLYRYMTKVGYIINTAQPDNLLGFPLNYAYPFSNLAGSTNGISILHGTQFSSTYPNSNFATEAEAKLSLIVYYPPDTTDELKAAFSACLEEIVRVQIRIVYEQL
jgi:hypothetical protein